MTSLKADAFSSFRTCFRKYTAAFLLCAVPWSKQVKSHSDQGEGISVSQILKEENDKLLWGRVIGWRDLMASIVTDHLISSSGNCALSLWLSWDLTLVSEDDGERQELTLRERSIVCKVSASEETQGQRIVFSSARRVQAPSARLGDSETVMDAYVPGPLGAYLLPQNFDSFRRDLDWVFKSILSWAQFFRTFSVWLQHMKWITCF